jgi:CHAD domain-containing protein
VADEDSARVNEELRWLAKACDLARNLDVFETDVLGAAEKSPAPPTGFAVLKAEIEALRERARADVAQAVASTRFRDLLIEVTGWVDTGAWLSRPPSAELARAFADEALQKRRRKLLKAGKDLAALDDAGRHKVRIQAKKLRYAAEGFQALYGRKATERFIAQLKGLQDELGELNDIVTGESLFIGLGLSSDAAFAAGELVGRRAAADKPRHIAAAAKSIVRLAETEPFWG